MSIKSNPVYVIPGLIYHQNQLPVIVLPTSYMFKIGICTEMSA